MEGMEGGRLVNLDYLICLHQRSTQDGRIDFCSLICPHPVSKCQWAFFQFRLMSGVSIDTKEASRVVVPDQVSGPTRVSVHNLLIYLPQWVTLRNCAVPVKQRRRISG
jgi:hypothetical protein